MAKPCPGTFSARPPGLDHTCRRPGSIPRPGRLLRGLPQDADSALRVL